MDTSQIPLFAMLRQRLGYLGQRERVIAENVANADTAGFTPRDIKAPTFDQMVRTGAPGGAAAGPASTGVTRTNAAHIASPGSSRGNPGYVPEASPDSETR